MREQEQQHALMEAGFANVGIQLSLNGLVLYTAEKAASRPLAADSGRRDDEPLRLKRHVDIGCSRRAVCVSAA